MQDRTIHNLPATIPGRQPVRIPAQPPPPPMWVAARYLPRPAVPPRHSWWDTGRVSLAIALGCDAVAVALTVALILWWVA